MDDKIIIINKLNLKSKNKLSKELKQKQNHRNGDHMECYQWGGGGEKLGKGTGIKKHIVMHKIDKRMLISIGN